MIVAQALANQKLVLDQITALNTTTSNLIESTSELLATQSVDINKQAASATVGIEKLQAAFANIYQSMDAIDTFKVAGARRDDARPSPRSRPRSTSRRRTSSACAPPTPRSRLPGDDVLDLGDPPKS